MNHFDIQLKSATASGFTAVASTDRVDRDGEVVDYGAFSPLPLRVPVLFGHDRMKVVGSGVPSYEQGKLMIRGQFASTPLGLEVKQLVVEKHVTKMSVGFHGSKIERDKNDGLPHIRSGELVEVSFVPVPSNVDAEVLSARHLGSSRKVSPAEWALAKARAQATIAIAQATLLLTEPEPIGDHAAYIRRHGAKAYAAAILGGAR